MRRLLAAGGLALAALVLTPGTAAAHAVLEGSSPGASTRVESLDVVELKFSERVDPDLSEITILTASGDAVPTGPLEMAGNAVLRTEVTGALEPATYLVTWRAYSSVDGHVTGGAFAFGFQAEPSAVDLPEPQTPGLSPLGSFGRFLFLLGFAVAFGSGVVELLSTLAVRRLPRLALGAILCAMAGVAILGHAQRVASGATPAVFLKTPIGGAVLARAAGLVVAAAVVLAWRRWMRRRTPAVIALLVVLTGVALVHAAYGHAAAGGTANADVAAQAVHLLAVSAWAGGLVPILVAIRQGNARRVVTRFSTMALGLVVVVAGTGAFRSLVELGGFGRLLSDPYGRVVALKLVLFAAILVFAAVNRRSHMARITEDPEPLFRGVRAEAVLATVVFAATGALANLTPPADAAAGAEQGPPSVTRTSFAGDLQAKLTVDPGTPGPNRFTVDLRALPEDEPVLDAAVSLRFRYRGRPGVLPTDLALEPSSEPGRYEGEGVHLTPAGPFEITVLVQSDRSSREILLPFATRTEQEVIELGGDPALTNVRFDDGSSVQVYLDPEAAGRSEVHATYFTPEGSERKDLEEFAIVATGPEGVRSLVVRLLSPGHPLGEVFLTEGRWRFDFTARTADGAFLSAYVEREIG